MNSANQLLSLTELKPASQLPTSTKVSNDFRNPLDEQCYGEVGIPSVDFTVHHPQQTIVILKFFCSYLIHLLQIVHGGDLHKNAVTRRSRRGVLEALR